MAVHNHQYKQLMPNSDYNCIEKQYGFLMIIAAKLTYFLSIVLGQR